MGGGEVTDRTRPQPPADTDAIALVIGHGKRADGSEGWEIFHFGPGVEDSTGGGAGMTDPDLAWEGEEAERVAKAASGGGVSTESGGDTLEKV